MKLSGKIKIEVDQCMGIKLPLCATVLCCDDDDQGPDQTQHQIKSPTDSGIGGLTQAQVKTTPSRKQQHYSPPVPKKL